MRATTEARTWLGFAAAARRLYSRKIINEKADIEATAAVKT